VKKPCKDDPVVFSGARGRRSLDSPNVQRSLRHLPLPFNDSLFVEKFVALVLSSSLVHVSLEACSPTMAHINVINLLL
jgi:hypothetical protein